MTTKTTMSLKTLFHLIVVSGVLLSLATITLVAKKKKNQQYHNVDQLLGHGRLLTSTLPTLKMWKEHSRQISKAATATNAMKTNTKTKTKKRQIRGGGGGGIIDRTRIQQPSSRRRDEVDDDRTTIGTTTTTKESSRENSAIVSGRSSHGEASSRESNGDGNETKKSDTAAGTTTTTTDNAQQVTTTNIITPTECYDVRRYVQNQQWEDPNINNHNDDDGGNKQILARNVVTSPKFAISVHNREYDRVRYSSIYVKGDYYEKKVRNRFLYILNEEQSDSNRPKVGSEETKTQTGEELDNNNNDGRRMPFVIDVGGNIGYYTLLSASSYHHVVTFEINPANLIRLCESIQLNLDPNDEDSIQVENVKPLAEAEEDEEEGRRPSFSKDSIQIYRYAVSNQYGQSLEVDIPKRNPGEAHVVVDADIDADADADADAGATIDAPPRLQEDHDGDHPAGTTTSTTKHQDLATLRHAQVITITLDTFATQQGWLLDYDKDNESSNSNNESSKVSSSTSTRLPPMPPPPPRPQPQPPSISILKIDTEGHEPQIIEGSKRLLQSGLVKNVLMEYRPATCRSAVIDVLLEAGYGIVYENLDRRILTLLGRDASETYLDPYRAGAAAHANDPRKGLSSSSSSSKTTASSSETTTTTTTSSTDTTTGTAKKSLDDGYEDLWFRLLSNPLPPSAATKYWSLGQY